MGLVHQIKREHARRKAKRLYRRTAHAAVGAIADRYGLPEDFVEKPHVPPVPAGSSFISGPFKEKKSLDAVPFFLADQKQHMVTKRIAEAADNPYLAFAHSPEEIILSKFLLEMNPGIGPDLLDRRHFETLILAELAKRRINELCAAFEDLSTAAATVKTRGKSSGKKAPRQPESVRSGLDVLRRRIRALSEFIDSVENPNGSEGEG
jgi:hypothetical protein